MPSKDLKAAPWGLRDNSVVLAKVVAVNVIGETESAPGGTALFVVTCDEGVAPDAPIDLAVT